MFRKAFIKLRIKWDDSDIVIKIMIISLLLAIFIGLFYVDYNPYKAKEENFLVLEEVAYNMVENKTLMPPSNETLKSCDISFNEDKTINICLESENEKVNLNVSNDFSVKSIERIEKHKIGWFIGLCIARMHLIFLGIFLALIIIVPICYWIYKRRYFKKENKKYSRD